MSTPINPTKDLVADLQAADRITRKVKWFMIVAVGTLIAAFAGYYVYSTQRSENQLKEIINSHYQTSLQANRDVQSELQAIQNSSEKNRDELNQQTQYFTCIISLVTQGRYPTDLANCPAPAGYVAPASSSSTSSTKTTTPTSTKNTNAGSGNNSGNGNTNPSSPKVPTPTVPTPPKQPSLVQQILKFLGL